MRHYRDGKVVAADFFPGDLHRFRRRCRRNHAGFPNELGIFRLGHDNHRNVLGNRQAFERHKSRHRKSAAQRILKCQRIRILEPVAELGRLQDIATLEETDRHAARLGRHIGIVQRLGSLIQVDILRITTGGSNHQVGLGRDRYAEDFLDFATARLPGKLPVSGKNAGKGAFRRKHDIQQKIGIDQRGDFHLVFVHFVAIGAAGHAVGVDSAADLRMQAEPVIALNCFVAADPWHDRFASGAKPGHQVIDDPAGQNDPVRVHDPFVDPGCYAAAGRADIGQVFLVPCIMLINPDPVADRSAADLDILFFGVRPVRAQRDDDENVLVRYAGCVQFVQQGRQELTGFDPGPGDVADDDRHRFARFHYLHQRRCADRIA